MANLLGVRAITESVCLPKEGEEMPESQRVTREELYDRVWSTLMIQLATEFGISDVGLAKICKRLNVPVPHRGYHIRLCNGICSLFQ
jgi:hypothetical protein